MKRTGIVATIGFCVALCVLASAGGWKRGSAEPVTQDDLLALQKRLSQELSDRDAILIGTMVPFAGQSPPKGWLVCDGSPVDGQAFPELEHALAGRFGIKDGKVLLPDLRGRFPLGAESDKPPKALGAVGGADQVVLAVNQLPSHSHGINDPGHAHGVTDPGHVHRLQLGEGDAGDRNYPADGDRKNGKTPFSDPGCDRAKTGISIASAGTGITVQNTGGGQPVSILPPFQVVTYIIKAK